RLVDACRTSGVKINVLQRPQAIRGNIHPSRQPWLEICACERQFDAGGHSRAGLSRADDNDLCRSWQLIGFTGVDQPIAVDSELIADELFGIDRSDSSPPDR